MLCTTFYRDLHTGNSQNLTWYLFFQWWTPYDTMLHYWGRSCPASLEPLIFLVLSTFPFRIQTTHSLGPFARIIDNFKLIFVCCPTFASKFWKLDGCGWWNHIGPMIASHSAPTPVAQPFSGRMTLVDQQSFAHVCCAHGVTWAFKADPARTRLCHVSGLPAFYHRPHLRTVPDTWQWILTDPDNQWRWKVPGWCFFLGGRPSEHPNLPVPAKIFFFQE